MNIAITATGGGVGQSILKALKGSEYNLIALDGEPLGAGLYMTDRSHLLPYANSANYIWALLDICKKEKVDILFPGMDTELKKLSENKKLFEDIGTQIVISGPEVIDIADDKFLTSQFLHNNNHPVAETSLWNILPCPFIMKPQRGGARSKDVYKIEKAEDIPDVNPNDYVYQKYIEGDEYTCGTVTIGGKYRGCIVMRRILRDGDTYKAFVEHSRVIEDLCEAICNKLNPFGALNIQLRMRDGIPYVFEFNARCSGTTAARALAGFNEPLMIADYLLKGIEPKYNIKEITILRYWNELVINNEDIINR